MTLFHAWNRHMLNVKHFHDQGPNSAKFKVTFPDHQNNKRNHVVKKVKVALSNHI